MRWKKLTRYEKTYETCPILAPFQRLIIAMLNVVYELSCLSFTNPERPT